MTAIIQHTPIVNRRKRKRRRRQDKSAVFARLVLDEHVRGDVGIVSEDLYNELFPSQDQRKWLHQIRVIQAANNSIKRMKQMVMVPSVYPTLHILRYPRKPPSHPSTKLAGQLCL